MTMQNEESVAPEEVVHVVYYRSSTGRLISKGRCPSSQAGLDPMNAPDQLWMLVDALPSDINSYYVAGGVLQPRPEYPATLSGTTLSGVVVPTAMWINGVVYDVQSDTVTLNFPNPGAYNVVLESWPYLDKTVEFTV